MCTSVSSRRRRALRRAVELPVELISEHVDQPLLYWATDLTPQGMWLDTSFPMQLGETVVVCFRPAVWWQARELMVFAQVSRSVWGRSSSEVGMGLEFLDISEHEQRALSAWLHRRPPPLPKRRARPQGPAWLPQPRSVVAA